MRATMQALTLVFTTTMLQKYGTYAEPPKLVRQTQNLFHRFTDRTSPPILNLSGIFRSPASIPGYERASGAPVFMVTTPWGSPYMIFERKGSAGSVTGGDDVVTSYDRNSYVSNKNTKRSKASEDENATPTPSGGGGEGEVEDLEAQKAQEASRRNLALYFTDQDDAICLLTEMKQMSQGMRDADIRILSTNMGRALRQSSILGDGLPSGGGIGDDGKTEGHLRYKLVPSSRQLYYASQCEGRERVGFPPMALDDDAEEVDYNQDGTPYMPRWSQVKATLMGSGTGAPSGKKRKSKKKQNKSVSSEAAEAAKNPYAHMRGKTGIPVFYAPGMRRMRGIPGRKRAEVPLFFSYEDLVSSWRHMRKQSLENQDEKNKRIVGAVPPEVPPDVEVFNFVDVVTSIDKEQQKKSVGGLKGLGGLLSPTDYITFVPSSRCVNFKNSVSAVGNGKARLRPMR